MKRDELIEAMARAMAKDAKDHFDQAGLFYMNRAASALTALEAALSIDITAIAEGRLVCVPFERLPQKSIYDGVMDNRERRLYYALKDLLDAVKERQGMRDSIESETLAQAERAMLAARSAPHDQ